MSKFLNDKWMIDNNFIPGEEEKKKPDENQWDWGDAKIADLELPNAITVSSTATCAEVMEVLNRGGFDQVPVLDPSSKMVGYATVGQLLSKMASKRAKPDDLVTEIMLKFDTKHPFQSITPQTLLKDLQPFFDKYSAAFVTEEKEGKSQITKVVTKIDLVKYFTKKNFTN